MVSSLSKSLFIFLSLYLVLPSFSFFLFSFFKSCFLILFLCVLLFCSSFFASQHVLSLQTTFMKPVPSLIDESNSFGHWRSILTAVLSAKTVNHSTIKVCYL